MKILLLLLLLLLFVLIAVILIRALLFKGKEIKNAVSLPEIKNPETVSQHLSEMIQCKTVSYSEEERQKEDVLEFRRFQELLVSSYPNIHQKSEQEKHGRNGLLYHIKGKSSEAPVVFMAHYDVVPADKEQWKIDPFEGRIADGIIHGRGTLDTKCTLCAIMESLERLLASGFVPANDFYLSFSGEEEILGPTCADLVSELKRRKIKPAFVLDEGGAIVRNAFPGVIKPCAMIGTAEKGSVDLELNIKSKGGHASTPPKTSPLEELSAAILSIKSHPFPRQMTRPVKEMFDTLGPYSSFGLRIIFANFWCFKGLFDAICRKNGGELNAMFRTTTAFTRMKGSDAFNVIPSSAMTGINVRLLGSDTMESCTSYLKKVIGNDAVTIKINKGDNPSKESVTDNKEYALLAEAIQETFEDTLVSPYLMMACSDSRHYAKISDHVYRFSGMELSKEERGMIHGINEQISVDKMIRTVQFYMNLMKKF